MISKIGRVAGVVFVAGLTWGRAQDAATNVVPAAPPNATSPAQPSSLPPLTNTPPAPARPSAQAIADAKLGHDVMQLCAQKQYAQAVEQLNAALTVQPKNLVALNLRGYVYSKMAKWDLSQKDFEAMLQIDDKSNTPKFNLAEIKFMQKDYAGARTGFDALTSDPDMGDLASYKIFLCDLLGGQQQKAKEELDAFNAVGDNASYYFANAAWELIHNKNPEGAKPWFTSAVRIYYPAKVKNYCSSLFDLGYLPLRKPAADTPAGTAAPATGTSMLDSTAPPPAK